MSLHSISPDQPNGSAEHANLGPASYDLRGQFIQLSWLQHRRFAQQIADLGLTVPQFYTLNTLINEGGQATMGRLARETQQVSATMTGIIDRMVRDQLVVRERSEDDRRAVIVEITNEGRRLVDAAWGRAVDDLSTATVSMSAREQEAAYEFVTRLVRLMEN